MTLNHKSRPVSAPYAHGDVLVLLSDIEGMGRGFYMVQSVVNGWATLRAVVDDEVVGKLWVTDHLMGMPCAALELFMPVGIRLADPA